MRVLVLNSGSSSLKFGFFEVEDWSLEARPESVRRRVTGAVSEIGGDATLRLARPSSPEFTDERRIADHEGAVRWVFEHLETHDVEAIGHRIVHGGDRFSEPIRIDPEVLAQIESLCELAPLHNPAGLEGIRAARAHAGNIPMVAVFDTAFHRTLPPCAAHYALAHEVVHKHGIHRFGFHGIAHSSMAALCARAMGRAITAVRLVTLHLGNGCSAAAIRFGESVDTSMGFTPLEGLVMGTRSGDLDPGVVGYLARREGVSVDEVERWLNQRSGLLGLSGMSHDMRVLLDAAGREPDGRASLALDVFCYRVRKYIGAYLAALGGAEAIVFGGGIGEKSAAIRERICTGMEWCGLSLDLSRNASMVDLPAGEAGCISREDSDLKAYVVAVEEETWIARETVRCLNTLAAKTPGGAP